MTDTTTRNTLPAAWLVLLAAAGAFALTMGVRQSMGLFIGDINTHTGVGLASVSLAFAFGQLWWGLTQPMGGIVADRWGAGRVMLVGLAMVALGTALVPLAGSTPALVLAIGVLGAGGAGLAGPAVLMAATMRLVPADKRGMATGIVNAGGSFGQFVFVPIAQGLASAFGWMVGLQGMAAMMLLALPAAWVLKGRPAGAASAPAASTSGSASTPAARPSARAVIGRALADRNFQLLAAGFFVCGFHVAFIATHLPGVVASCQLPPSVGAWSLAVVGLFNIAGSLTVGWVLSHRADRWRMKSILSLIYATRAVAVLLFVLAPKTPVVMLSFAAVIGFTYLSTVPPTAGLVARFYGPANMGTLFGLVMVSHQVGGFLGAWLGGQIFVATGSFNGVWAIDIALAVAAALLHLPIRETLPGAALKPA